MRKFGKSIPFILIKHFLLKNGGKAGDIPCDLYESGRREGRGSAGAKDGMIKAVANVYDTHSYLKDSQVLSKEEKANFDAFQDYSVNSYPRKEIASSMVAASLQTLSGYLDRFYMADSLDKVRYWYDGFRFGDEKNIYNPWSITKYLDAGRFGTYWANTGSNHLVSRLIREGDPDIKVAAEDLLSGRAIRTMIDEEIVFDQLGDSNEAVWSLLLASGYLRVERVFESDDESGMCYELALTNLEVKKEFHRMIQAWFKRPSVRYNDFVKAMMADHVGYMNQYMNQMASAVFSFFDTGKLPSDEAEPERFYHGFVLRLMADAKLDYGITSNQESSH